MEQSQLSDGSNVLLLLTSHLGSTSEENGNESGLGPAGWHDFRNRVEESSLDSVGDLLSLDKEAWPSEIWTNKLTREWVTNRLRQSSNLAMELESLNNDGIWVTTEYEETFPEKLADALGRKTPPFLYVAGEAENFDNDGIGFVGSRDADSVDKSHTRNLVNKVISEGYSIVSGGAKGIDETSEDEGLAQGGPVIEFPADGIETCLQDSAVREAVMNGNLTLASRYHPTASWSVGGAMGRNKLIHGFAEYTVVVRSGDESGGTWAGATENLDNNWSALVVCSHADDAPGNDKLIKKGGIPINPESMPTETFLSWIERRSNESTKYHTDNNLSMNEKSNSASNSESSGDIDLNSQSSLDDF